MGNRNRILVGLLLLLVLSTCAPLVSATGAALVTITPNTVIKTYAGQSTTFTTTATRFINPSYFWSVNAPTVCPGYALSANTASSFTYTPNSNTPSCKLNVLATEQTSVNVSGTTFADAGQMITLTATPANYGATTLSYQWYNSSSGTISGATSNVYTATAGSIGTFNYYVTIRGNGASVTSNMVTVVANTVLNAGTVSPASPTIDSGQSITLTANPSGGTKVANFSGFNHPHGLAFSPDGKTLYVANYRGASISVVNTSTGVIVGTLNDRGGDLGCGEGLEDLVLSPNGNSIYVVNNECGDIPVVNTSTGRIINTLSSFTGGNLYGIAISPNGNTLYLSFTNPNPYISIINTSSGNQIGTVNAVSGSQRPQGIVLANNGNTLYVANSNNNTVSVVNLLTKHITNTIANLNTPEGVAISPDGSTLYVSNDGNNTVSAVNVLTRSIVNTISISGLSTPRGILVSPDGNTIYIASYEGTVFVTHPYTYLYQWHSGTSSSCSSDTTALGTAPTQTVSPTSNTYYCYSATDSATIPANAISGTDKVTVNPVLQITAKPSTTITMDVGQSIPVNALATGGTGSFTYGYTSTGTACTGFASGSTNTVTFAPTVSGTCAFTFTVNDIYASNSASTATITVNPAISITSVWASNNIADQGQLELITGSWTGGTSAFTANFYVQNAINGNVISGVVSVATSPATLSFQIPQSNDALGVLRTTFTVTDSAGSSASTTNTFGVNSLLVASAPTATNMIIDNGQSTTFMAHPSGGTTAYSYVWYFGASSNCASDIPAPPSSGTGVLTSAYTTQPSSSTTYYCYQLTDSASTNNVIYSSAIQVTVNPTIQITAQPSTPVQINQGQPLPVNALATGGTGSFTYGYTSTGTACTGYASGSTNTLTFTPAGAGQCTFTFTANDIYTSNSASTATITVVVP